MDEVRQFLLAIRKLAGDAKWKEFPSKISDPFRDIYNTAGLALDALVGAGQGGAGSGDPRPAQTPPAVRKQLVVLEVDSSINPKVSAELSITAEKKLTACGIPHELLVLPAGVSLTFFAGDDSDETSPPWTATQPPDDPATPGRTGDQGA